MADTFEYFNTILPEKLRTDPDMVSSINAVFQFDVEDAGTWTVDLTGEGKVLEGPAEEPGCVIMVGRADWEAVVDEPSKATPLFMMGKLKTTNLGLAIKLQRILS